jgi:hypothetical protein
MPRYERSAPTGESELDVLRAARHALARAVGRDRVGDLHASPLHDKSGLTIAAVANGIQVSA